MSRKMSGTRVRRTIAATVAALLLLTMTAALAGCGGSPLVGKWENEDGYIIEFKSDGTGSTGIGGMSMEFKWKTDGDTVEITIDYGDGEETEESTWEVNGNTLIIDDEEFKKV